MRNVITIQHTQSEQHINKMIGSLGDWSLTEYGIRQAHSIGKNLADEYKNQEFVIYSSDLPRADENIIIVSHDGTLSILYALWFGMDIQMLNQCNLSGKTGGVSVLQEDDDGNRIILRLNDMSYMKEGLK